MEVESFKCRPLLVIVILKLFTDPAIFYAVLIIFVSALLRITLIKKVMESQPLLTTKYNIMNMKNLSREWFHYFMYTNL